MSSYHYQKAIDLLPKDEESISILNKRAMLLAKEDRKKTEIKNGIVYVKFQVDDGEYYGISYQHIKDVNAKSSITKVPCLPDYISGVINHRGLMIPVVDIKKYFQLSGSDSKFDNNCIIIVETNTTTMGFLVDNVLGSYMYDPLMMDHQLSIKSNIKNDYIVGLNEGITAILNIEIIVSDIQNQLVAQVL